MKLEQRIQSERERVAGEIENLKQENETDFEILNNLKQEYNAVVLSPDETKIDSVNDAIKTVSGRITRRKEKLEALQDKNNPVIQNIISEAVEGWANEKFILEEQAEALKKELEPMQKELLKGLEELVQMKYRVDTLNSVIRTSSLELNETNLKKLNLTSFSSDNKVLSLILPLLVEHRNVFRVR